MEALGAAGSIVGIVSFGLGLAQSLQTFIATVAEAEESLAFVVIEVDATASTLRRLQDLITTDEAKSQEQNRPAIFNAVGKKEINSLATQCEKVYQAIVILIEKASIPTEGEKAEANIKAEATAYTSATENGTGRSRLEEFSIKFTIIGRKLKWPWLEPRIKRCQQHLHGLKISLMLSLQIFLMAEKQLHHDGRTSTDEAAAIRETAENLQKRHSEHISKMATARSGNPKAARDGNETDSLSGYSGVTASTTETSIVDDDSGSAVTSRSAAQPSLWRRFAGRSSRFVKDRQGHELQAYVVQSVDGVSQPPQKIPFGRRRLAWELKQILRENDPWREYLSLNVEQRSLVDKLAKDAEPQKGVLLIALTDSQDDFSYPTTDNLLLFFCYPSPPKRLFSFLSVLGGETASAIAGDQKERLESDQIMEIKTKVRAEIEAKHEAEMKAKEEAKAAAQKKMEEEAVLKKALFERARAEAEANFKAKAAGADNDAEAKAPIKFKDAVGRKFSFPFHLCRTWQGMEGLIKEAFRHVEVVGPHVQQGHYDLMSPESDEVILPSSWEGVIRPGMAITMHMWPIDRLPARTAPGPPPPPGMAPPGDGGMPPAPAARFHPGMGPGWRPPPPPPGMAPGWRPPPPPPGMAPGWRPPRPPGWRPPPPGAVNPNIVIFDKPKKTKKKARQGDSDLAAWLFGSSKRKSKMKTDGLKDNNSETSTAEEAKEADGAGEAAADLDRELGLGDFAGEEEEVEKDIDELLGAWTNPPGAGDSGSAKDAPPHTPPPPPSPPPPEEPIPPTEDDIAAVLSRP